MNPIMQQLLGGKVLIISPSSSGVTLSTTGYVPVHAGVIYNSSGVEYQTTVTGTQGTSRGNWLDAGNSGEVWIERTINSGILDGSDPGAGRHQLNTTRTLSLIDQTGLGGADTANITVRFYDAATGGNQIGSVTYTLSADMDSPYVVSASSGGCSDTSYGTRDATAFVRYYADGEEWNVINGGFTARGDWLDKGYAPGEIYLQYNRISGDTLTTNNGSSLFNAGTYKGYGYTNTVFPSVKTGVHRFRFYVGSTAGQLLGDVQYTIRAEKTL